MTTLAVVVTTIQPPTPAISQLFDRIRGTDARFIVIGDKKGPASYPIAGIDFLDLQQQLASRFELARRCSVGHYARKNVGYLEAIHGGASSIYETDDDNAPLDSWALRAESTSARTAIGSGWMNVYTCFTGDRIWPRGMPLDGLVPSFSTPISTAGNDGLVRAPIQQGLANGSPDVDAIWRLVLDRPFNFDAGPSILLQQGSWCPFNSQSTWWWPDAFPLLYLPSHCSFRMTDIWRSFIAQRCLWELGLGVVFHAAEVFQDRNEHDLMRDFDQEIVGYQRNRELAQVLSDTVLLPGVGNTGANLRRCYESLTAKNFFPPEEMELVACWLADLESIPAHG